MTEKPEEKRKRNQGRSPSYPGIDLKTAIERADTIKKEEGRNIAPSDVIMDHWGYAPKSGPGLITLAALKKFGLLEDQGTKGNQQLKLTDLAWQILLDDEESEMRQEAVREAALKPKIHCKLWDAYGRNLPSDPNLRRKLLFEEKFTEGAVDEFIDQFKRTIRFANLIDTDTLSEQEEDKISTEQEDIISASQPTKIAEPPMQMSKDNSGLEKTGPMQEFNMALSDGKTAYIKIPYSLKRRDWEKLKKLLDILEPMNDAN